MIHMPKGTKVLKDLLSNKEKIEKAASLVKLNKECSAIIQRNLPQKEGDQELIEPLEWRALENRLNPSVKELPKLELKELFDHLEYAFLQEDDQLPVVISSSLSLYEKAMLINVLKNHKGAISKIILIEVSMEVFMDDFSVFGSSFDHCLANLENMLKRCKETNLVLNWEKCHFMVIEGIFLGHKVSGSGIKVDRAKIESISKLPYPTNLLVKDAPFIFSEECTQAFDKLKKELTQAPIMIKPDWSLPFEIMCDAGDYVVGAVLG
ncbi:reverse transcriptase domain-containing protein [Tanacetum coccineum]